MHSACRYKNYVLKCSQKLNEIFKEIVWKTPHSVATYIVGPHNASGTHSAILCKSGSGRHAYMCAWP